MAVSVAGMINLALSLGSLQHMNPHPHLQQNHHQHQAGRCRFTGANDPRLSDLRRLLSTLEPEI